VNLTPDDAEAFWTYLRLWQNKLGLTGWRITRSPKPANGSLAEMSKFDWRQQQVMCRLGLDWKATPITPASIEQTAVHELLHVLLHPLIEVAKTPGVDELSIAAAEHSVINTLEGLLVPNDEDQDAGTNIST
jgi:hypothetical protein